MSARSKLFLLLLSIGVLWGVDKEPRFAPGPATSYPNRQTQDQVTIAAIPYDTSDKAKQAFGKLNPNEYGLLPVLIVIQNESRQALNLEKLAVEYVAPDRTHIEATPASEVRYLAGGRGGKLKPPPLPTGGSPRLSRRKNPLEAWEIEGRAFTARMLPPGESAHGFFYFQTGLRGGALAQVAGIRQASTGKEFIYFEVPLAGER